MESPPELPSVQLKNIADILAQYYCTRIMSLLPDIKSGPIVGQFTDAKATLVAMIGVIEELELFSQRLATLSENIERIG